VVLDVATSSSAVDQPQDPHDQRPERDDSDEDQPEPDEKEDLLVEEIDGKDALDSVAVYVAKTADLHVAECRAGKQTGVDGRPVAAEGEGVLDEVDAEGVVGRVEEVVENEELANGVEQVDDLDEKVEGDEKVAAFSAARSATGSRQASFETQ
jgi:hypothetical protein